MATVRARAPPAFIQSSRFLGKSSERTAHAIRAGTRENPRNPEAIEEHEKDISQRKRVFVPP